LLEKIFNNCLREWEAIDKTMALHHEYKERKKAKSNLAAIFGAIRARLKVGI
jgi:hypothetical protein